jgi:hypothetical protein
MYLSIAKRNLLKKNLNKIISLAMTSVILSACGDFKKDPTDGYEVLNTAEVPRARVINKTSPKAPLYFITTVGDFNFVQGEENKITFLTHLAFADIKGLRYELQLKEGPQEGPKNLKNEGGGVWSYSWQPPKNLLNEYENYRTMRLVVHFVILPESSAASKAEFAGHNYESTYNLTLQRDRAQPVIEDQVTVSPSKVLAVGQSARVVFTVAAGGLDQAESLRVDVENGPRELGNEVAQLDGREGLKITVPKFVKRLGKDDKGRERLQFEVTFDAKRFYDYAMPVLESNSRMKTKLKNKEIKEIEAVLVLQAVNNYNNEVSPKTNIVLKVTVPNSEVK